MTDILPPYPEIEPHKVGMMDTGDGHSIYWETSGNPDGIPAIFLHGGPGSGSKPYWRRLFDPKVYNIIQFDQRGSGKSTPHAVLENNTTPHLVADMEALRGVLGIDSWVVTGGSWGSTLALAYADAHPSRVRGMMMYGIFLARAEELRDTYFEGGIVSRVFPDVFEPYINLLPPDARANPIKGYHDLFHAADKTLAYKALDLWTRLENKVSKLVVTEESLTAQMSDPAYVLAHSKIENHYFLNLGFIDGDALLARIGGKLEGIPVHIVQGRYDMVCPFKTAWELHKAIPHSRLHVVDDVGHTAREPKVTSRLVSIMNTMGQRPAPVPHIKLEV